MPVRRSLRSLRSASGIALPLVLALWAAVAAALAPSPARPFTVATAPAESYKTVAARFTRLVDSGDRGGVVTSAAPGLGSTEAFGPSPIDSGSSPEPGPVLLNVQISADRRTAKPGGQITYAVEVRNVGQTDASGVLAESHVPAGTSMSSRGDCLSGGKVPGPVCSGVDPGDTPPSSEHISHAFDTIHPGRVAVWWFTVTVDLATPVGKRITNHAHAFSNDVARMTTDDVVVTVN